MRYNTSMSENQVCPEKLAAFDARAAAAKAAAADFDYVKALQIENLSPNEQENAAREFRLRGIEIIIKGLKQKLSKEEATAFNRYLKQCPRVDEPAAHTKSQRNYSKNTFRYYTKN